jgi:DNA-sulfur modification-associated
MMTAHEFVEALRNKTLRINPDAQRSIVSGSQKVSTEHLLDTDKVEKSPRMQSFIKFCKRVMNEVEKGKNTDGFFGAPQFAVPAEFKGARLEYLNVSGLPDETKLAVLRANPLMGEAAIDVGDGQGRGVGFHAFERAVRKHVIKLRELIKKKERRGEPTLADQRELEALEEQLKRIHRFLSTTSLPFVCYVDHVDDKGQIHGISLEGERRLYIEGNALNARAAQEEMVKYEYFSPVIVALQELRTEASMEWMSPDYVEEDSKSISRSSTKLFTLSALAQAYSLSIIGKAKPLKAIDADTIEKVDERKDFCEAFWKRIAQLFRTVWLPDPNQTPAERLDYLRKHRDEDRNVLFSAILLQALGQVCHWMGKKSAWDAETSLLAALGKLDPNQVDYRAAFVHHRDEDGDIHVDKWNPEWTNAMMKATFNEAGNATGYAFNNVADSITRTRNTLLRKAELLAEEAPTEEAA